VSCAAGVARVTDVRPPDTVSVSGPRGVKKKPARRSGGDHADRLPHSGVPPRDLFGSGRFRLIRCARPCANGPHPFGIRDLGSGFRVRERTDPGLRIVRSTRKAPPAACRGGNSRSGAFFSVVNCVTSLATTCQTSARDGPFEIKRRDDLVLLTRLGRQVVTDTVDSRRGEFAWLCASRLNWKCHAHKASSRRPPKGVLDFVGHVGRFEFRRAVPAGAGGFGGAAEGRALRRRLHEPNGSGGRDRPGRRRTRAGWRSCRKNLELLVIRCSRGST
jgi:hypothetical protein